MGIDVTDVQKALKGVEYPADGEELAAQARENDADDEIVEALLDLSEVEGPTEVMQQMKQKLGDELGD